MLKNLSIAVLFAVLMALAWVVPPHALGRVGQPQPEATWQWLGDGMANLMPLIGMPLVFALGLVYGMLSPRYFWFAFVAAWWICPFNIALDDSQYPTSHNLLPIELLMHAVISLPALAGAWIGRTIANKSSSPATSPTTQ